MQVQKEKFQERYFGFPHVFQSSSHRVSEGLPSLNPNPYDSLGTGQQVLKNFKQFESKTLSPSVDSLALLDQLPLEASPSKLSQSSEEPFELPDFIQSENERLSLVSQVQAETDQTKRWEKFFKMALQMGNLELAMLMLGALEAAQTNQVLGGISQKIYDLQEQRKKLTLQMAGLKDTKKIADKQNKIQDLNDQLQLLTAFVKDLNDQKNHTIEFAHNFLTTEHQTAMQIIRG